MGLGNQLPSGWVWTTVREAAKRIQYGYTQKSTPKPTGPHYLRITDIQNGAVDWDSVPYCKIDNADEDKFRVQPGDILFARSGATAGKTFLVKDCPRAVFASYLIRVQTFGEVMPEYLFAFLTSPIYWDQLTMRGIAQPNANAQVLGMVRFPLPPFPEQRRIVSRLGVLLAQVWAARRALQKVPLVVRQFSESVLAKAFRGELTERDANDEPAEKLLDRIKSERRKKWGDNPKARSKSKKYNFEYQQPIDSAELPANWARVPLGYFCDLQVGIAFKSHDFKSSGIRLLRGANISPGTIYWTETKYLSLKDAKQYRSLELRPGDTVIGMDRPIISSGLKVARVNESDIPALLVQRVGRFIPLIVRSEYLYHLLLQDSFVEHLLSLQTGTDLPHVSATDILSFVVPLAPVEEQKRIVAKIEQLFSYADDVEDSAEITQKRTHSLEQAILSKAFRGELLLQDPNDEPASVLLERIRAQRATVTKREKHRLEEFASPATRAVPAP